MNPESHVTPPKIWRLHIKNQEHVKVANRCHFCIEQGIAGMGWGVGAISDGLMQWDQYAAAARSKYKKVNNSVAWLKHATNGDLVWTRDMKGVYWLGRLCGEWEYRIDEVHADADIHNVRACEWHEVGTLGDVPGAVRNAFIQGPTLQGIRSEAVLRFSMDAYNRTSGRIQYVLPPLDYDVELYDLFDPADCEDLVGIYLQLNDYVLYPSTCKPDTHLFEFALRHRKTGRMAAVQVKQGNTPICVADYEQFEGDLFLFQTRNRYEDSPAKATTKLLDPAEMTIFCLDHLPLMTPSIQGHVEWTRSQRPQ